MYRRLKNSDTWHWHPFCQHSKRLMRMNPGEGRVVLSKDKPKSGELCNECQGRAKVEWPKRG